MRDPWRRPFMHQPGVSPSRCGSGHRNRDRLRPFPARAMETGSAMEDAAMRAVREIWPVLIGAAILSVASVWVVVKLDSDGASIRQDRYERFMDGTRGV